MGHSKSGAKKEIYNYKTLTLKNKNSKQPNYTTLTRTRKRTN